MRRPSARISATPPSVSLSGSAVNSGRSHCLSVVPYALEQRNGHLKVAFSTSVGSVKLPRFKALRLTSCISSLPRFTQGINIAIESWSRVLRLMHCSMETPANCSLTLSKF